MKKVISIILIVIIIMTNGCSRKGINKTTIIPLTESKQNFDLPWKEPDSKGELKPYSVKPDLSDVSNSSDAGRLDIIERYLLSRNLFIIKKPDIIFEQHFDIYEKNRTDNIPSFITADSILHIYHLLYDYFVRNIERERLIDELKVFTEVSFMRSMEIYRGIRDASAKKAALKNIAYFGIAMRLLEIDLPGGIPLEANRIIDNDVKRVKSRWGTGTSEIFPYYIDYKKYIARGHYSRETDFRNYLLTMMWYGNTPLLFEMQDDKTEVFQRMDEQIIMGIIMTSMILGDENLRRIWDDIYRVSSVYWGKAEDVTLYDMSDIIKVIYGEKIDFNKLWSEDKIQKVYELAKQRYNLHSGQTLAGKINRSNENNIVQTQFRLMGQIYNLDTDIYNNLTTVNDPYTGQSRLLPKGLDVPAAFGNYSAYTILNEHLEEDKVWTGYTDSMERLRIILSDTSVGSPGDYSLNNSLFWILRGYLKPVPKTHPTFMINNNWAAKKLQTYTGSVSDMRHPTYLNAKQGEKKENNKVNYEDIEMPGYVEPDVGLYSRLEYMARYMKRFISINNFVNSSLYATLDSFIDSTAFLRDISIKELENTELTEDEKLRLGNYADELKNLTMSLVEGKGGTKQWETVSRTDRNMAAVTDAFLHENQVLQTAVGNPDYIYVIVPYKDRLYMTRGSVYTYYEFIQPVSRKYNDGEWQDLLKNNREPEQPSWIQRLR